MSEREMPAGRRPISFWFGLAMVLTGIAVLGWVGWQFFGTNWVSKRAQQQAASSLEATWKKAADPANLAPAKVPEGKASALIRIPKFAKDYVIPVFEGVGDDVLAKGYGHFRESANPGQVGNYAVAAHRVTHGEPLRKMPDLRPGDKVLVETVAATYTYVLDSNPNDLNVDFHQTWVVEPLPKNPQPDGVQPEQKPGQKLITLTTCSELFHTDLRMIAFGHLESVDYKPGFQPPAAKPGGKKKAAQAR